MADLVRSLLKRNFATENAELLVGNVRVSRLAEQYGTPLFLYDRRVLDDRLEQLRATLPGRFSIFYSVKANPNAMVVRHFLSRGCGLEVASAGEFRLALDAGCRADQMLFAGPGKTESELELVLTHGIGELHLESETEAERADSISRRLGIRARVAIRVNPSGDAEGGAMRMGGRPTPFGIDEEMFDRALDLVLGMDGLDLQGIHMFTGTQILDVDVLLSQYRHGLQVARKFAQKKGGTPLGRLDFGGGLGIPYFPNEKELDLEQLRMKLQALFAEIERDPAFLRTEFVVEPGRFLVGEGGVYVARVTDIKVSRGKKFLILDGGMNHHLAASGNLGQTIKRNYPVALLNKLDWPAEETVDVVGPLCTPLDTLARNAPLPRAEIGDLFGIFQSGAYGYSASPLGFLSHATPAEVWVDAGQSSLVRPRGMLAEILENRPAVLGGATQ